MEWSTSDAFCHWWCSGRKLTLVYAREIWLCHNMPPCVVWEKLMRKFLGSPEDGTVAKCVWFSARVHVDLQPWTADLSLSSLFPALSMSSTFLLLVLFVLLCESECIRSTDLCTEWIDCYKRVASHSIYSLRAVLSIVAFFPNVWQDRKWKMLSITNDGNTMAVKNRLRKGSQKTHHSENDQRLQLNDIFHCTKRYFETTEWELTRDHCTWISTEAFSSYSYKDCQYLCDTKGAAATFSGLTSSNWE